MKEWIKSFDGLRFFFILFLMFHHFDSFSDLGVNGWNEIMSWLKEGSVSVNFFFLLSGFVVQYAYKDRLLNKKTGSIEFLFNRLAHLYPTYLLFFVGAIAIYSRNQWLGAIQSSGFLLHLFALQSWIPIAPQDLAFKWNGLAWAVSTEIFFYLAFIFLVFIPNRYLIAFASSIFIIVSLQISIIGGSSNLAGWFFYISPFCRLLDFLIGMVLCNFVINNKYVKKNRTIFSFLELLSLVVLFAFVAVGRYSDIPWQWRWQIFYLIPCAIIVFVFSFNSGVISEILGKPYFSLLGKISFPLYLCHQEVFYLIKIYLCKDPMTIDMLFIYGIIGIILSIVISFIVYYTVTKPVNMFLRRVYKGNKSH